MRALNCKRNGYDIAILSDLLHFFASHDVLVVSVRMLLAKTYSARVYVGVSSRSHSHIISLILYTNADVCDKFLKEGRAVGLHFDEIVDKEENKKWLGTLPAGNLDHKL